MRCRLIRQRPEIETEQSILIKCHEMTAQVNEVKNQLKWIKWSLDSSGSEEEFIKKAAPYILLTLY